MKSSEKRREKLPPPNISERKIEAKSTKSESLSREIPMNPKENVRL